MKNSKQTEYKPLNTVQTVLSQDTVNTLERILYWKDNMFDDDVLSAKLLQMLQIYIKANHEHTSSFALPHVVTGTISDIVQLNDWLMELQRIEKPLGWVETVDGYREPVKETNQ